MAHIAWLGKKSPFCGNVTYGLSTTEALRQRGIPVEVHHFAGEGHGFRSGAVRVAVLEATEAFFRHHFGLGCP